MKTMYNTEVYEKAIQLCGYDVIHIRYNHKSKVVFSEGYIPGVPGRFFWNSAGLCFRKNNRKRMPEFDLPISSAQHQIALEDYYDVCR